MNEDTNPTFDTSPSFIQGHLPQDADVKYQIGPYQVLKTIGKGGMGEVLLAYDTKCGRRVALKRIREDLLEHKQLQNRFLKEARITSQLTHPAIIPIYAIEDENQVVYYTMPFVQGETLKQVLRTSREQEKKGKILHHLGSSIPALIRIFISVCQAIAYAHSKGVLHRDIKPENVIIGEYGEILILDWGLAKLISIPEKEDEQTPIQSPPPFHKLTRPGKIVGTVNYMAPERAEGHPATIQTEIYSLGVLLYQILTLRNPFRRGSIEEFKSSLKSETIQDPATLAPYRDVPQLLARAAIKCLEKDPSHRYQSVDELLRELENYLEGRSEWFAIADLNIRRKEDWEFQEHVLMADHIAITREMELTDWVNLMISKASFNENTKLEAEVCIGPTGYGIGFLMSVPEAAEREHLNDGYCLWLGSDINKSTKLLRSTVEVLHAPDIYLLRGKTYKVRIEKIDHNIHFYLNNTLQFSYISHLPLVGTHLGILSRDGDFEIHNLKVYIGSQNITVNCLAVPDAFLAHKAYASALAEYRRIGYSFPGRAEGREAMFRAGLTLLEQAKTASEPAEKESFYDAALAEFNKLHSTPGAPLEYLGKAHVYQAMNDIEEEVKCYELGFRKYPKHPLLSVIQEQLVYRMHETARVLRKATYRFMLTALTHLPEAMNDNYTKKIFESLQKHWEPLFFIEEDPAAEESPLLKKWDFRIKLAFWLAAPHSLLEIADEIIQERKIPLIPLCNALFSLVELGAWRLAKQKIEEFSEELQQSSALQLVALTILATEHSPELSLPALLKLKQPLQGKRERRVLLYLLKLAIQSGSEDVMSNLMHFLDQNDPPKEIRQRADCLYLWYLLLNNRWEDAREILNRYPLTSLTKDTSFLFTLYGCWLGGTESKELAEIHFAGVMDVSYPRTWNLLGHFISGKITDEGKWGDHAFLWEKRHLYRQLELYYHCVGDDTRAAYYRKLEKDQYRN